MAGKVVKSNRHDIPKTETVRHLEIFEIYYALGDARSLKNLSEIVDTSEKTLQQWSSAFGWQDRVTQRDQQLIRRIQDDFHDEVLKYRCLYIELVKEMIAGCISIDKDSGKRSLTIKPENVKDLKDLINLHLQLMGACEPEEDPSGKPRPGGSNFNGNNFIFVAPEKIDAGNWMELVKREEVAPVVFPQAIEVKP